MTELLYLADCYLKEFDAQVLGVEGNMVELDKTAFYPESGGQPSDKGKLVRGSEEFTVVKATKQSGKVLLELDRNGIENGDAVHGVIDWNWRYKMMRMHSAAHVITMAIQEINPDVLVTGGQIGFEESRDDYCFKEWNDEIKGEIERKANEIVKQGIEVQIYELPREEAFQMPQLFKLRDVLPPSVPMIRIVRIGDDLNACGGTHVKNTLEIGRVSITKTKSKGLDNRRIYYSLGEAKSKNSRGNA